MPSGGKRKGAGRKPAPEHEVKKTYSNKYSPTVCAYFRSLPNAAQTIESMVVKSRGFKAWKEKQK